jgi:hypothetical protein
MGDFSFAAQYGRFKKNKKSTLAAMKENIIRLFRPGLGHAVRCRLSQAKKEPGEPGSFSIQESLRTKSATLPHAG